MKKRDIENKIRSAFYAVSPDKLDSVLGYCENAMAENSESKAPAVILPQRKRQIKWVYAGALALVALCVSTAFILNGRRANELVIGSVDSKYTESLTVTESYDNTESDPIADSESTAPNSTVIEPTEDTVIEPTEDTVVEPTEVTAVEPTEKPTEIIVPEPTEATVVEPTEDTAPEITEDTGNGVADATESVGGDDTSSANTGDAFCPMPDPEYRSLLGAIDVALRYLADETGNLDYHRKDESYVYAWLGETDGEAVYYVSYCIGKHRIDCTVPVIYKDKIANVTISPLVVRGPGEQGYIGTSQAKSTALTDAGVSEGAVSALNVTLDRYKQRPSYLVSFYYNGSRYFYDLDAVSGKILSQNMYDLTALKNFIREQHKNPYYIDPDLLTDDLLFERIMNVRSAAGSYLNSRSTDGLSVERIVNDDILDIDLKNYGFVCRGEITGTDGYLIFYEESSAETSTDMLNIGYLTDALKSAGIESDNVLELNAVHNGEIFDVFARTEDRVYKFGILVARRPKKSSPGNITYFGKTSIGTKDEMELLTADSALQKALFHAGVTEYTLVECESIKLQIDVSTNRKSLYFFDISFKSGEYTYKYKVDVFTGEVERYLYGSGKGEVSDVVYSIGNHTGFSANEIKIIIEATKNEFAAWFDGCKLEAIWFDNGDLEELNNKYRDYFYTNFGTVVGIRFVTGADYNGNYGLEPNKEYEMYCLLYNNFTVRWEAIGYVFE